MKINLKLIKVHINETMRYVCAATVGLLIFLLVLDALSFLLPDGRWAEFFAGIIGFGTILELLRKVQSLYYLLLLAVLSCIGLKIEFAYSPSSAKNLVS